METHPECAMCFHAARIETAQKAVQLMEIRPYKKSCIIPTEKVIDKMFNYPTASLMFRTEYTRDLQDYSSPVGDIPIQLHMAAKGTVYYIDRKMSVYRQGVTTSWSALMKEGKIIAFGTHEELLQSCSEYCELWETQIERYEDIDSH